MYSRSIRLTVLAASIAGILASAQAGAETQLEEITVTARQRAVRTGWMNLSRVNIAAASTTTIPSVIQNVGWSAKITRATMFQHAGKPENDLSAVFIRVSAK